MAESTAAHARDLGDYAALGRRRWVWIVGSVAVGFAVALMYLSSAQETYVSTAKVLVESTGSSTQSVGERTSGAVNLDTEAQLVKSEPVSVRAGKLLGSSLSPVELANRVSVTVPPNTTVMNIAFAAGTAQEAQRGAAMVARAYLEHRQEAADSALANDISRLESQIERTQEDIQETSVAIVRLSGPNQSAERAFLIARRSTLSNQLASYNAQLAPLMGTVVNAGQVIHAAQLPKRPVDPNPMLILPTGLMVGLVMGVGLAAWRDRFDRRIHTGAELERLFGMMPMAALTARNRRHGAGIDHDVRALYHSLRANGPDRSEVVLLVGPDDGETAEHLSHSLAVVSARTGSSTAYVTRPNSPVVQERRRFELERTGALSLPSYEDLGVMVNGEFRSVGLRRELDELATSHDFLILGLPNDDPSVDLPILGRHVDVTIVVVRLGVTRRDTVAAVLADLTKCGVDRVFAVTVDLRERRPLRRPLSASEAFAGAEPARLRPLPEDRTEPESSQAVVSPRPPTSDMEAANYERRTHRDQPTRAVSARRSR